MEDDIIPADVRQFLLSHIETIAQWEGLLLLRAHRDAAHDSGFLARGLYIGEAEAGRILADLVRRRFVSETRTAAGRLYAFAPASDDIDALIGRAADLYRQYLIPVTHLIHSRQTGRVQAFADAFRVRKD